MNPLIMAIRLHTGNLAVLLGMSDSEALQSLSVRELLIYLATMPVDADMGIPISDEPEPPEDLEQQVAAFSAEVLGGNDTV